MVASLLTLTAGLLLPGAASAVNIDWVTVGGAGNACDTQSSGCFGAVADAYRISKYEVTNAQYTEFLNAVAATDTRALYNIDMGNPTVAPTLGGITRSGGSGSYSYSTIAGREDMPVNWVSFWDSLRFANWLHNGQGNGGTETGAYTITPTGIAANSITRNVEATFFLPSESEWYKAAYYDVASASYFDSPAGTDMPIACTTPGPTANTANCDDAVLDLTDVGSYTGSASPNGTFDQGGNVWEWNEAIYESSIGSTRRIRGGAFNSYPSTPRASSGAVSLPAEEYDIAGFRIASLVPEPTTALLMAASMLGLAAHRRRLH